MVFADHGEATSGMIVVARLFRFRDGTGYGVMTEQGFLAVRWVLSVAGEGAWQLEIERRRICKMEVGQASTPGGRRVGCLAGQLGIAWYIAIGNPTKSGPQATLYQSVYPPR